MATRDPEYVPKWPVTVSALSVRSSTAPAWIVRFVGSVTLATGSDTVYPPAICTSAGPTPAISGKTAPPPLSCVYDRPDRSVPAVVVSCPPCRMYWPEPVTVVVPDTVTVLCTRM